MRILIAYRGLPWPIWEGYHLRILHLFRRLAQRHEIHLLGLLHEQEQADQLPNLQKDGFLSSIQTLWVPQRSAWGRFRTNLGLGPVAAFHAEYPGFKSELRERVAALVQQHGIEVAYVFDTWADLWFEDAQVVPTLLDVCDCRSFFYARRMERGGQGMGGRLRTKQLLKRFTAYENHLLRRYPAATVVSPLDRDYLLKLYPQAKVEVIPNGVDLDMFAPQPHVEEVPGNLIFFGNMDFLPNVDAAIHFAKEIFPKVRAKHPEATFTVVGSNPLPEVKALAEEGAGVEVTGRVDDLQPWIAKASMLVAPMRFGAGIKNKILESMAMEKAVVTNATGVEAMYPEVRNLLRIAKNDDEFANQTCELLDRPDLRKELGEKGRRTMQKLHSWETAADQYEKLFQELLSS